MSQVTRWVATMKRIILIALFVVFVCEAAAVSAAKESVAFQATAGVNSLPAKVQQRPQQNQENGHLRLIRRSHPGWIPIDKPEIPKSSQQLLASARQLRPFFHRQWNTDVDRMATSDDTVAQSAIWRDNELTPTGDSADDKISAQEDNWNEAQLTRQQESDPVDMAAFSTWQHSLGLHPQPNRLSTRYHQPPSSSPGNLTPQQDKSPFQQVPASPLKIDSTYKVGESPSDRYRSLHQTNQTGFEDVNENLLLLPMWPKRSSDTKNKSDRENRNRNAANHKEKTEAGVGGALPSTNKGNKGKTPRKQQHKQQQQESVHRPMSVGAAGVAATSGTERDQPSGEQISPTSDVSRMNRNLASQFLLRSPRENRQYDVPIIECPPAEDGMERFACPTPDLVGRYRCIDDHVLCDNFIDCPGAEDEDGQACMFYKTMKSHLDLVADALLRWVRGR